jgi:hypothetical protein
MWGRDTSNYNALQMTLTARNFYGLSMTSGYTYSRTNHVASGNGSGVGTNSYNVGVDYGRGGGDLRHRFTLSPSYVLPSVMGYGGLLEGWRVNGVFRYQTGRPWQVTASNSFGPGAPGNGRNGRPDFYGDPADFSFYSPTDAPAIFHPPSNRLGDENFNRNVPEGTLYAEADLAVNTPACAQHATTPSHLARLEAYGCWERNGSVIMPSDLFSFGTLYKGIFDGPGYWNLDFSVSKRQRITERIQTEFRAEMFNIFNHPNFENPSSSVACSESGCQLGARGTDTPDVGATNPVLGSGGPRRVQLGVRIIF